MSRFRNKLNWIVSIILGLTLIITLVFSYKTIAYADEGNNVDYITTTECEIAGNNWLMQNYEDETSLSEIIPIVSQDGLDAYCLDAYCIDFSKNNQPNGYLVLDAHKYATNYIREFSLSGKGIYQTLIDYSDSTYIADTKIIYSLGGYDYAVSVNESRTSFYSSSGEFLSKNDLLSILEVADEVFGNISDDRNDTAKQEYYDGFFSDTAISSGGGYTGRTITGADSFIPSIMSELRVQGGYSGNCSPTASTNLLSYYREMRGFTNLGSSRQDIYNKVVAASGWDQFGDEGQTASAASNGIKKVVENAGYKYKSDTYWFNLWSDWTRDINNNYPVYTSVRGLKESDGSWVEVGHAIIAVGYREYGDGARYLRVYDGWNRSHDKYIWFNSDYFKSIKGIRMEVNA